MFRELFTNNWVLCSIGFLILLSIGCIWWYHYDTAPDRKAAADAEEIAHQWDNSNIGSIDGTSEQISDVPLGPTQEGNSTETRKNPFLDKTPMNENTKLIKAQNKTDSAMESIETVERRVSPFGFGTYPEVPDDYPYTITWENRKSPTAELLSRVLIKLWNEGEKNFRGGSTHNGKIYPHYNHAIYVGWHDYTNAKGKTVRKPRVILSGPHVKYTNEDIFNPPPGFRVLDFHTSGISPYQYLNLESQGEK